MPEMLSNIGQWFGQSSPSGNPNWITALLGATTGAGEIGNFLAGRQRADLMAKENAFAKMTPQQLSARVAAATQPLSTGLTQAVGNTVQGEMGERGLAQSPGIYSAALAQALAPYYQQNQATALQQVLAQMQIPLQEAALLPPTQSMAPLLALLMKQYQRPSSGISLPDLSIAAVPTSDFASQLTNWFSPSTGTDYSELSQ